MVRKALIFSFAVAMAAAQTAATVPLTVAAGVPLRVYLVERVPKRLDAPVRARLLEPLFAFDREVVPAGTEVAGRVSRLGSETKMRRVAAGLGGDFTPLHDAYVQFTTLVLPDGRRIAIHTAESAGLNSIFSPPKPSKRRKSGSQAKNNDGAKNGGVLGVGKQKARDRIEGAVNARTRGVAGLVRGPDKKERLEDFLWHKLPYHPQRIRKGTRFDAALTEPLQFGSASLSTQALNLLGTQPPSDCVAQARLITPLTSATATKGDRIEAVVSRPVLSPDQHVILPAGTHLSGAITRARRARWFHRGGQLQFDFRRVELPAGITRPELRTEATLEAAEPGGKAAIKVDREGGVKTEQKKTRLLAPLAAAIIASRSNDNDAGRRTATQSGNAGARTVGGASGFGLLGAAAGRMSPVAGSVLGFYGLAWSVYATVIARGGEVEFGDNAALEIRFGPPPPPASRLGHRLASAATSGTRSQE